MGRNIRISVNWGTKGNFGEELQIQIQRPEKNKGIFRNYRKFCKTKSRKKLNGVKTQRMTAFPFSASFENIFTFFGANFVYFQNVYIVSLKTNKKILKKKKKNSPRTRGRWVLWKVINSDLEAIKTYNMPFFKTAMNFSK